MAAQIPVKAIYSGSDVTSLGEYASGDTIADSYIAGLTASKLTGALPAISGAALTNLPADATKLPLAGGTMTGNIAHASDFTIDVGGDLLLDVDGADVRMLDGGTDYIKFTKDGNNSAIKSQVSDGDLILRGSDGGSQMDALTLDMSEAGAASFNSTVTTTGITVNGGITEKETTKTASFTPNLTTDGTIFDVSGNITITMPSATAGKSFTIIDSGSGTLSWGGTIKWAGGSAPSPSGITIYSFISNGTNWYGMMAGTGFA